MCTHPIKIKNRKIDFSICLDKEFLYVPCGHCHECRDAQRRSYEIRAYYEWRRNLDLKGETYFYTLTYNEENVPIFANKRCFRKRDVQLFLRRLDARLWRAYGFGLRYFLTSEYGHKGTKRPHYHALFFLDKPVGAKQFRKLISETWKFGWNCPGHNYGIVQNINAVRYVAKYVCKDIEFVQTFQDVDDPEQLRNFKPFHLQSQGFGAYVFNCMSDIQKQYGTCSLPDTRNGGFTEVSLPTYCLRKLYYRVDRNSNNTNSYILTEQGVQRKLLLYNKLRQTTLDKYESFYNNSHALPQDVQNGLKERSLRLFGTDDFDLIYSSVLDGRESSLLYDYATVYAGRSAQYPIGNALDDLKFFLTAKFEDVERPFEQATIDTHLYNKEDIFKGFDELLSLIDYHSCGIRYLRYLKGCSKYNSLQRQRYASGQYKELKEIVPPTWDEYINPIKPVTL